MCIVVEILVDHKVEIPQVTANHDIVMIHYIWQECVYHPGVFFAFFVCNKS